MSLQGQRRATAAGPAAQLDRRAQVTGILLVNLATLSWATNMALGRYLRADIGPLTLAAGRFLIAAPIFAALLARQPAEARQPGRDRWLLLGMALSGVVAFPPLLYLGLRYTTAVNATLINGFGPLITGLLAAVLISEPMSRRQVVGAFVALAGIAVLISGSSLEFWREASVNIGDLITLGSAFLWGLYSVLGRRVMQGRTALSATALSAFFALPVLILAALWELQFLTPNLSSQLLVALLYIGIVPTVGGFLAWNAGVRRLGVSGAMVFYNTLPLYGALIGYLALGEPIGFAHLAGGGLIIGGGLWAARRQ
ncbi:MAG: DMT family transporter [Anaerolineae bacterium]|nr:DMT family transporter [Anaerolineae bacterium]